MISRGKPPSEPRLLHPRNRHQGRYDFAALLRTCPALAAHMVRTADGHPSIDFADPAAVRLLNRALIASQYGILDWQFPNGYLCPPIPGRADYLHGLADLLAAANAGVIPRGATVRALDIGVGASCIYPLLGHVDYGWRFIGSDIDSTALASAQRILTANQGLGAAIELRLQSDPRMLLKGVLNACERIDLTLCNPPFHASAAEAADGSTRKWQNLGKPIGKRPALNFGGQAHELWCRGGEAVFVRQLIAESAEFATSVCWFSSLIAKSGHLTDIGRHLTKVGAREVRTVNMAQGQKQSRFVAWTFLSPEQREAWRHERW